MIKTSNLTFTYDNSRNFNFPDIACQAGDSLLVLGESGVGKSTLLHILGGLLKPIKGSIKIDGRDIVQMSRSNLDQFRGNNIGIIFQQPHFIQAINMMDNLLLTQKLGGRKENEEEVKLLFNRLRLGNRIYALPGELSQGELQRASIIRAVINEPALLIADEPTSALDDTNTNEVISILTDMSEKSGSALVIVTHDTRLKSIFKNQLILN